MSSVAHTDKGFDAYPKFGLGQVELWILLAAIFGAILAVTIFQLCRLCKIRVFNKNTGGDICHIESQKVIDSVIQDGLNTVAETKKVVVMNIHLVPCNHHPSSKQYHNPNQNKSQLPPPPPAPVSAKQYLPQNTELTPHGAIMMQARTCRTNILNNKHLPLREQQLYAEFSST